MRTPWLVAAGLVPLALVAAALLADRGGGLARESEALQLCEYVLTTHLKSPASYARVELREYGDTGRGAQIFLTYDAANLYGTRLRGQMRCRVTTGDDGRPELADYVLDGQALSAAELGDWTALWRAKRTLGQ